MKNVFVLTLLLLSPYTFANDKAGNGGDFIRYKFISIANDIFHYMDKDPFKEITLKNEIDIDQLRRVVRIKNISISTKELIDNNGSVVDAVVIDGHLYLDKKIWWERLVKPTNHDFDTQMMVLHETFRLAGVNDDDYKITDQYKALDRKVSYQNNFGTGRDFICQVDLYEKIIDDDGFSFAVKGELLGSATHRQKSSIIGGDDQKLFQRKNNRVIYSVAVIGGDGYLRWSLAESDKNALDSSVYNRKFISGARTVYSSYPEHNAINKETTVETDEFLIDISCNVQQKENI